MRVTAHDGAGNTGTDASNAVFTISDQTSPSVAVTSPNGGETWATGSSHDVTWTAGDKAVTSIDIDYSVDGGLAWLPVATGEANDGSYAWSIPDDPTTDALVRVTAHDGAGNSSFDVSDSAFAIADEEDPSATVTSPNGAETWATGSSHDVTWTATDNIGVASIDIDYSVDGGLAWLPVATGEANDGSYAWSIPDDPTTDALVRVTAHDGAANSGSDTSDAVFAITDDGDPSVTVTAPNGGETWEVGTVCQITWTATDNIGVASIDIDYSVDGGLVWVPVAAGEANDGTYDWTVPGPETVDAIVRVTAYDDAANSGSDVSDAVFTIDDLTGIDDPLAGLTRPTVLQNRPNPFNPNTVIGFALPTAERVVIEIYAMDGRLVRRLVDGNYAAGVSQAVWDGRTDSGRGAASGVYFYRFTAGSVTESRRLVLSK